VVPLDLGAGRIGVAARVTFVMSALDAPAPRRAGLLRLEEAPIGLFSPGRRHPAILSNLRVSIKPYRIRSIGVRALIVVDPPSSCD
jgi:hypothetical protein